MITMEGEDGMPKELVRATPSCQDIAERGEAIYGEKYRAELERTSNGKFIAINVANAEATLADTGEDAIRLALEKDPAGFFHLIRVGHKAAFEAGWYMSCAR
jgi:alkaline phosphatase